MSIVADNYGHPLIADKSGILTPEETRYVRVQVQYSCDTYSSVYGDETRLFATLEGEDGTTVTEYEPCSPVEEFGIIDGDTYWSSYWGGPETNGATECISVSVAVGTGTYDDLSSTVGTLTAEFEDLTSSDSVTISGITGPTVSKTGSGASWKVSFSATVKTTDGKAPTSNLKIGAIKLTWSGAKLTNGDDVTEKASILFYYKVDPDSPIIWPDTIVPGGGGGGLVTYNKYYIIHWGGDCIKGPADSKAPYVLSDGKIVPIYHWFLKLDSRCLKENDNNVVPAYKLTIDEMLNKTNTRTKGTPFSGTVSGYFFKTWRCPEFFS